DHAYRKIFRLPRTGRGKCSSRRILPGLPEKNNPGSNFLLFIWMEGIFEIAQVLPRYFQCIGCPGTPESVMLPVVEITAAKASQCHLSRFCDQFSFDSS